MSIFKVVFQSIQSFEYVREVCTSYIYRIQQKKIVSLIFTELSRRSSFLLYLQNLVEEEGEETAGGNIQDMQLQHNELRSLDGSLFLGMKELQKLNLSYNALGPTIGQRDLRGLDGLKVLDLSHNELTTLEDTSEV